VTWHRLADHPLPEPREGQVLLVWHRCRPHPDTFICKPLRGNVWLGGGGLGRINEMREYFVSLDPNAQWYLVPAPGEPSEADGLVQCAVLNDPDEMVGGVDAGEGDDS
jgi:hypothetical protein